MARIGLNSKFAGIRSLFAFKTSTAQPMMALAEELLRGPSPLEPYERELIAVRVSFLNGCEFCYQSHSAIAAELIATGDSAKALVEQVAKNPSQAPIPEKLKRLLLIASKVAQSAKALSDEDFDKAKQAGADEETIHDTVLIAAAFAMFNRYVDGLAAPGANADQYQSVARQIATNGYGI